MISSKVRTAFACNIPEFQTEYFISLVFPTLVTASSIALCVSSWPKTSALRMFQ